MRKIKDSMILRKIQCPQCASRNKDTSRDNLAIYLNSDGSESANCFSCGYYVMSADYKKKYGKQQKKEIEFKMTNYSIQDWERDVKDYSLDPKGFRGLKKATCVKYRVRHEYDEETGQVAKQYYSVTQNYQFSGVKVRIAIPEKDFNAKGVVKKTCDLFGENIFKDAYLSGARTKVVVLTSGELDALTTYQMLNEDTEARNQRNNTDYPTVPVLSGIVGELGNVNQYKLKYDFLNNFDKIIYIPDQDEAGEDALHALAQGLPRDKLFVVNLPNGYKDPTEMLEQGKQKEFIKAYWDNYAYNPAGIVGSSSLKSKMKEDLLTEKVPLPPFMSIFEEMLAGGLKVESIVNIGAASGCLSADTEYLTEKGWMPFNNYTEGTKVAQYNSLTNSVEFVTPNEYIVDICDTFFNFKTLHTEQSISSDHSFVYLDTDNTLKRLMFKEWIENPKDLLIPYLDKDNKIAFDILNKDAEINRVPSSTGFKYCFSVSSEMLVVRYKGKVFITGNCGKTTLVNEMIYFWIFNSPYKIGIISLELSASQYGVALGSRHLGKKLALYKSGEEAVAFLELPENDKKLDELYNFENGLDRFHLVDERDGGIEAIKKLVEKLIISCDCRVIILDPLQDVMAGLSVGEQEEFLAWMKSMIKRYRIIFININHVRKSGNGSEANSAGAMITEEDFAGSSTIFKSAAVNLLFTRNKYLSDDNPYKNVIHSYASKNRNTGLTGDAGDYFYENSTHTLYSLEEYKSLKPQLFADWEAKEQAEKDKMVDEAKVKYNRRESTY